MDARHLPVPAPFQPPVGTDVPIPVLGYLAQLPLCRDAVELLQTTLSQACHLTEAPAGLALVAGVPGDEVLAEGPVDPALRAAAVRLLPAPTPDGEVPLGPPPDPLIWTDTLTDSTGHTLSVLYIALAAEGHLQGLLALALPAGPTISPTMHQTLDLIAAAAGGALATQRALTRTLQRLTELSLLYEVATVMGSTLELSALLKAIMRLTQTTLRSEACTLMLLDAERGELVFEIPLGEKEDELTRFRIALEQGVAGWVARTGRPAIVNDLPHDPRFNASVDAVSGFRTRAVLCVPLQVRGQVIGVLEVLNKMGGALYTQHDLALLTTLGGQAAVAIDNARLYRDLHEEHARMLNAEEEVRRNLARDLHDGPAQDLAALSMGLEVVRRLLDYDPSRVRTELENLESLTRRASRQIRTLQFELRPIVLETRGLRAALESYIQQLAAGSSTHYTLHAEGCKGRLPGSVEQATFSVVQEALGNTRKHARATEVSLHMLETATVWMIQVRDNGQGFDVDSVLHTYDSRGSLGLLNMRERATAMGGQLIMQSTPGQGTTITLYIPWAVPPPGQSHSTPIL